MELIEVNWNRVPIWVHFKGIPLELFTMRGIGYLASAIGIPLYMDRYTAERKRLEYAKVCAEMDMEKEVPRYIEAVRRNGKIAMIEIEVPWKPIRCEECKEFGPAIKECPHKQLKAIKQIWKPKAGQGDGSVKVAERHGLKEADSVIENLDIVLTSNKVVVSASNKEIANQGVLNDITNNSGNKVESSCSSKSSRKTDLKLKEKMSGSSKGRSLSRFALLQDEEDMAAILDNLGIFEQSRQPREVAKKITQMMDAIKPGEGGRKSLKAVAGRSTAGTISSQ
ncbi:hypothetical protein PTKIN_Ptkin17bG0035800 [Pterospermum kingtungense]